jgi:hypothetical protein
MVYISTQVPVGSTQSERPPSGIRSAIGEAVGRAQRTVKIA